MVALFGLSSKGSPAKTSRTNDAVIPPPPYSQDTSDSTVFATEMTTTTTTHVLMTTTQTTTHFFSLPLWRRRGGTPTYNAHSTDELGAINTQHVSSPPRSTLLIRNKELPPTPELSPDDLTPPTRLSPDAHTGEASRIRKAVGTTSGTSSRASSLQPVSRSSYAPSDSHNSAQPTVALARAALGLGLPHAAPASVSASSSSSEVNALAFPPAQSPSHSTADLRPSNLMVRHAKSFHKEPDQQLEVPPSDTRERRRTRGFSLGPLHLMVSDAKGKQREADPAVFAEPPEGKALARKSSFWSRRRVNSRPDSVVPPSPTPPLTLPMFPPVSPFDMSTPVPSSGLSASPPNPDLHRRHSERMRKGPTRRDDEPHTLEPTSKQSSSTVRVHRRRSTRPQTADSPPVTGSRLSFFSDARSFASSPTSSPIPTPQEAFAPPLPATPSDLRTRAQSNPPLLHRLSINLFGPSSGSALTPPTNTSSPNMHDGAAVTSPPSSLGSSRPSLSKPSVEVPRPNSEEETPESYLQRLIEAINKGEVATVLASSTDAFHARALRAYIERFNFVGDPLDVAVRKLLMDVGLPRETQQIDRVIEAFAARYVQCNPNLFSSEDHPYILAFSLIMLHTDAFNKSNKRKMTKADYVKNTRLPGVAPEVLECFYDNIVFAPFIFIEDPLDVNGQRGLMPDAIPRRMSTISAPSPGGSALLGKSSKIDPYYLITRNLLDDLRVDVHSFIPPESPFHYRGTATTWDEDELQRAFALAGTVEMSSVDGRYLNPPWFTLNVAGGPGPVLQSSLGSLHPLATGNGLWNVKVTKVGLLLRKEDIVEGGKRAMSRKWREWCVLLAGSQLMFFRDTTWATHIQTQSSSPTTNHLVIPHTALPHPEEMYSVRDSIAVFDKLYTKHPHTWRFVLPDRRQFLLQGADENDMNEWVSRINYAAAFRTAGVRMRALGLSNKVIELTGIAAAASHLKDVKHHLGAGHNPSPIIRTWTGRSSEDIHQASHADETLEAMRVVDSNEALRPRQDSEGFVESDPSTPPFENTSRLFKATFDEVKTELAAARFQSLDQMSIRSTRKRAYSLESTLGSPLTTTNDTKPRLSTRPDILKSKVEDLEAKLSLAQTQLDIDMRFVRNLAVLTPFQRATRDRLQAAVQIVAKRVIQVRLDIEKLSCYREVLTSDLAAEERDWQRTKHLAMQAATRKLVDQRAADQEAERRAGHEGDSRRQELPKLTLSAYVDQSASVTLSSSPVSMSPQEKMSGGQEGNSPQHIGIKNRRNRSSTLTAGSSKTLLSSLPSAILNTSLPSPGIPEKPRATPLATHASLDSTASTEDGAGEGSTHEKFYTALETPEEQAEEWNKTRAAKRVSLVKLPSDLRISMFLGKHARESTATPDVAELRSSAPTGSPTSKRSSPTLRRSPYEQQPSATVAMFDL